MVSSPESFAYLLPRPIREPPETPTATQTQENLGHHHHQLLLPPLLPRHHCCHQQLLLLPPPHQRYQLPLLLKVGEPQVVPCCHHPWLLLLKGQQPLPAPAAAAHCSCC
jgi:hypothetical protein